MISARPPMVNGRFPANGKSSWPQQPAWNTWVRWWYLEAYGGNTIWTSICCWWQDGELMAALLKNCRVSWTGQLKVACVGKQRVTCSSVCSSEVTEYRRNGYCRKFVTECLVAPHERIQVGSLYQQYNWCRSSSKQPRTKVQFGKALTDRLQADAW